MKKIIFLSLVFALAANVSAQLTVDAAKNVGIGTTTPKSKLDVVGNINLSGSTADIIARTSGVPIKFKIGSVLAGNTGSSGQTNVSFGYHALSNTTGSCNTAHGYRALYSNTPGSYNTAIGLWADVNTSNLSNTTAVGFDAKVTSSNKELSQELIEINKKAKEKMIQTGFLAQDVEETAKSIGYDFSGVDVDETGIYGLRYAEFVVPLVKAVQELSEQNDRLQEQVNELTELVSAQLRSENVAESTTGLQSAASRGASLQQNSPNPFMWANSLVDTKKMILTK